MAGLQLIPGSASQAQQTVLLNTNLQKLQNESVTKIYKDKNGVNNILIGIDSSGSSRIIVAEDGVDVLTATDDQLIFNSRQNILKIVKEVDLTLTISHVAGAAGNPNVTQQAVIAHGLSFIPTPSSNIVIPTYFSGLFDTSPTTNETNPALVYANVSGSLKLLSVAKVNVDATNVYLTATIDNTLPTDPYTYSAKVLLLQESFS